MLQITNVWSLALKYRTVLIRSRSGFNSLFPIPESQDFFCVCMADTDKKVSLACDKLQIYGVHSYRISLYSTADITVKYLQSASLNNYTIKLLRHCI